MTIAQFFSNLPKINGEINPETRSYMRITDIEIGNKYSPHHAIVSVAHVGNKEWSFGYDIRNGGQTKPITKPCCPGEVTKGEVQKLLLGVLKAMYLKVQNAKWKNKANIFTILKSSIDEAVGYVDVGNTKTYKITI